VGDLERGYTDETPPSDRDENTEEMMKVYEEGETPVGGFIERNNYDDRL